MAHHKRKRPKHRRAGCLMCKPHKDNRSKGSGASWCAPNKPSVRRRLQSEE